MLDRVRVMQTEESAVPFILTNPRLLLERRTRIVATVGPASREPEVLQALLDAGVDVFRLNMSHGSHEDHRIAFERIREQAAKAEEFAASHDVARRLARESGLASPGEHILLVRGFHEHPAESTPSITVLTV